MPSANTASKPRQVSSTWTLALIVVAMALVLLVAGLPGTEEQKAGDGSDKLRHGWARRRAEQAAERADAPPPAPAEPATPATPAEPRADAPR